MDRYSRNRIYLSNCEQQKLKNFSIVIAGSGIGSNIAECALRTGFEKICVIDGDLIENSNLNRQNYTEEQIGTSKATALYERLKSINAEISFINEFISSNNMPETGRYNVGWGGLVTVLSPKGPLLKSIKKSDNFNELDVVEYAASYQRYWQKPQIWLEEAISQYRNEELTLPPPQLAIGSWYVAAMCTHLLVKIATGKFYKKFPEFYLSSLFQEEENGKNSILK